VKVQIGRSRSFAKSGFTKIDYRLREDLEDSSVYDLTTKTPAKKKATMAG
jgi:hypothetical protein